MAQFTHANAFAGYGDSDSSDYSFGDWEDDTPEHSEVHNTPSCPDHPKTGLVEYHYILNTDILSIIDGTIPIHSSKYTDAIGTLQRVIKNGFIGVSSKQFTSDVIHAIVDAISESRDDWTFMIHASICLYAANTIFVAIKTAFESI